jgi:4-diphosphocytidyl-2-C-methyl-D-erythritol kinase
MASTLTLRSYGKINLFLSVGKRREDGYHGIMSTATTVELHDELTFEMSGTGIEILEEERGDPLPPPEHNIIYRAIEEIGKLRHFDAGIRVRLKKRIPIGAGLGGGSSNGWAAIRALDMLLALRLSPGEKLSLSSSIGSDVSLFMHGGAVRMTGRGEIISPLADFDPFPVVIVKPPFSINTGEAYGWWDEQEPGEPAPPEPHDGLPPLHNDFEKVLFPRYPVLEEIKRALMEGGCEAASLTGSGSALYGLVNDPVKALSIAGSIDVSRHGRVMVTRILGRDRACMM